jgi:hypothetical protein
MASAQDPAVDLQGAKRVFDQLVRQRRAGKLVGSGCKVLASPVKTIGCLAVLRRDDQITQLHAVTAAPATTVAKFAKWGSSTWTRRWRPLTFRFAHSVDGELRGSVWVNAPEGQFDWGWLVGTADATLKKPETTYNSDGPTDFPDIVVVFRCVPSGREVLCQDKVGDALRLRRLTARRRNCGNQVVIGSDYDCVAARDIAAAYRRRHTRLMSVDSAGWTFYVKCDARGASVVCRSQNADDLYLTFPSR